MNGVKKKVLRIGLGGIAAAFLMAGGQAYAVSACPADESLTSLLALGSCQISDKIFSDFSFTTDLATHVLFGINAATGEVVVTFSRNGVNTYPNGINKFDYMVTVAPSAPPGTAIVEHNLGVDVSTLMPKVTTTDMFTGNLSGSHTLTIPGGNGGTVGLVLSPGDTSQMVMITADQPAMAQLNSISNDYAEHAETVPEPASLSLLGLGLLGLGFARRRRS